MKALILNSGMGSRMGVLTSEHPRCMTEVSGRETILSRQPRQIAEAGIQEVVMTTGLFDSVLVNYCRSLELPLHYTFVEWFRRTDPMTPVVVVPTSFNTVTEEEFRARGVNVVIYANQLTRTGFPAMQNAAKTILAHHRAKECDEMCMPVSEIINLIPEDE